jgi:hypothetical protein
VAYPRGTPLSGVRVHPVPRGRSECSSSCSCARGCHSCHIEWDACSVRAGLLPSDVPERRPHTRMASPRVTRTRGVPCRPRSSRRLDTVAACCHSTCVMYSSGEHVHGRRIRTRMAYPQVAYTCGTQLLLTARLWRVYHVHVAATPCCSTINAPRVVC